MLQRGVQSRQTGLKGSKLVWLVCVCSGIGRGAKSTVEAGTSGKTVARRMLQRGAQSRQTGLKGGKLV